MAFAPVVWRGRTVQIEHAWVAPERRGGPLIVFLHEGLGSLAMWKGFPAALCAATGARGLVYSRPGYGRSTPRGADEVWSVDYMHQQAFEVLPALLATLGVDAAVAPPWLYGHSDGGSIALLHAARYPASVAGLVVAAPHIMVEDISVANIQKARMAYVDGDLRPRLAEYHDEPDSAFWGWNRIWLDRAFRDWSITAELAGITCPVLAVQGVDDEYGTLAQVHGIARVLPRTELLELPACGHSAHRDQRELLINAAVAFIHRHRRTSPC